MRVDESFEQQGSSEGSFKDLEKDTELKELAPETDIQFWSCFHQTSASNIEMGYWWFDYIDSNFNFDLISGEFRDII